MSSGKSPGADVIPAEVYKAGGLPMAEKLTELFHCMWRKEAIPQEFKDASIIHLYKRKGNPQVCDKHRGISLINCWKDVHLDLGLYQKVSVGSGKTEEQ